MPPLDRPPLSNLRHLHADPHGHDTAPIVVCLQRRLDGQLDGDRERQFFKHARHVLASCNEYEVDLESWMITSYEVDFGPRIGVGGLYVPLRNTSAFRCLMRAE